MIRVRRAVISVSDKTGIADLGRFLADKGVHLLSSGGTSRVLRDAGVEVEEISSYTGFPEMLDGRIKTLHPRIHGGILARATDEHMAQIRKAGIEPIDMVVVNLYPFRETVEKGAGYKEAVEQIDIGGPTLVRSAAKNHERVLVVVDPTDYPEVMETLEREGGIPEEMAKRYAYKAFDHTARYDITIASYLWRQQNPDDPFPPHLNLTFGRAYPLRYGENPHQKGAFYLEEKIPPATVSAARQLHGKQLSFNNILDVDAAVELVKEFSERPTVVEIKHTNPCGIASADTIAEAYRKSHSIDPMSAFGGVVAANRPVDEEMAREMKGVFVECLAAPSFTPGALEILRKKKNIRLLELGALYSTPPYLDYKRVAGGLLVQESNLKTLDWGECRIVTDREPTPQEKKALEYAWRVVKHVKSNAVVYAREDMVVGIGAGQMSRVDSAIIAARKGGDMVPGSVMASDAFFPFRDAVDAAAEAGITAAIQPGGSIRDHEVIQAANEHDMAMVFTGYRVFRH
ncbi:MAG: bifunctional phosphoribosylaminoimidazolecarboxamide formyltransferase/IMP cyclohydrolase [Thermoplasmata archaeon]|nr:bifunctional phosphoribosylaminoimidazolecarboxamide formyltransferase/IMP cyclohydrolase [Thermoplasmata archaeon]